jgi:CheY-like chemotaxis protein
VTAVGSGEEGLQAFQPHLFDALVTDLNLPGMSGLELAEAVLRVQPGLKIVIASGVGPSGGGQGGHPYANLTKPYRVDELEAMLQGAVAPAAAG